MLCRSCMMWRRHIVWIPSTHSGRKIWVLVWTLLWSPCSRNQQQVLTLSTALPLLFSLGFTSPLFCFYFSSVLFHWYLLLFFSSVLLYSVPHLLTSSSSSWQNVLYFLLCLISLHTTHSALSCPFTLDQLFIPLSSQYSTVCSFCSTCKKDEGTG